MVTIVDTEKLQDMLLLFNENIERFMIKYNITNGEMEILMREYLYNKKFIVTFDELNKNGRH